MQAKNPLSCLLEMGVDCIDELEMVFASGDSGWVMKKVRDRQGNLLVHGFEQESQPLGRTAESQLVPYQVFQQSSHCTVLFTVLSLAKPSSFSASTCAMSLEHCGSQAAGAYSRWGLTRAV